MNEKDDFDDEFEMNTDEPEYEFRDDNDDYDDIVIQIEDFPTPWDYDGPVKEEDGEEQYRNDSNGNLYRQPNKPSTDNCNFNRTHSDEECVMMYGEGSCCLAVISTKNTYHMCVNKEYAKEVAKTSIIDSNVLFTQNWINSNMTAYCDKAISLASSTAIVMIAQIIFTMFA